MHNAFLLPPACLSPPLPSQLSFLLGEGTYNSDHFLRKHYLCFPEAVPRCPPGQLGCKAPSLMETHPMLCSRSCCKQDERRDVCTALLLLSEAPITQGQAEAGANPLVRLESNSKNSQFQSNPKRLGRNTRIKKKKKQAAALKICPGKMICCNSERRFTSYCIPGHFRSAQHWAAYISVLAGTECAVFDDMSLLTPQYTFIPSVLKVSLVEVVFLGNSSEAELFWVIFLLLNFYVFANVAVTPREGTKSSATQLLQEQEKACRIPGK